MEKVLFLTNCEPAGTLGKASLEALGVAKLLAESLPEAQLEIGIVGSSGEKGASAITGCGASCIRVVLDKAFDASRYATDILAAEALFTAVGPAFVIAPGSSRWNRVMPGLAARVDGRVDTHVTEVSAAGPVSVTRWYYRQRMKAVLHRRERPWVILVDPGSAAPWVGGTGESPIERFEVTVPEGYLRTEVAGLQSPATGQQTIRPDADLLFVAGAGWTKVQPDGSAHVKDAESLILQFLSLTQASLGGSKSAVDLSSEGQAALSFITHLNQVGQTGASPRHPKGLATCCHGEEPHVVGWRFVNERRAINLDPNCGWAHGKADVLYVGDAFKIMARVNELLGSE